MEIVLVSFASFTAAMMTFFSGFGLGTVLMPAFAIFFPLDVSIALTAIVHFLNNIFKLFLVGKFARRDVVIKFGTPAIVAALFGAWLLSRLSHVSPIATYFLWDKEFSILWIKVVIATVMIGFTFLELVPSVKAISFSESYLPVGGLFSGFFGGLSGHQGALRSAFLVHLNLSKESFIGTGVVIACLIDLARMSVYSTHFLSVGYKENLVLLAASTVSAFLGTYLGSIFLKKVTMNFIQRIVAIFLILLSITLAAGIV